MRYIILHSAACMPPSCRYGQYRRIAVIELSGDKIPKNIDSRSKSIARIVMTWERLRTGKTRRCAFARAMREAIELCDKLNGKAAS